MRADASETARRVAALRLGFRREPAPFGRPDADQLLQADVAARTTGSPSPMARYLQARTTFFDRLVLRAIERGTTQLVAVGAGYDGRSLRYATPAVRWFELDHPATQADKVERLTRLGIDLTGIEFAAADFERDDAAAALGRTGHDRDAATVFLCEGVAGYLSLGVLRSLLASLRRVAAPGSQLVITISLEPDTPAARASRERLQAAVSGLGEPLSSSVPRSELDAFCATTGWLVQRAIDPAGAPIAQSERTAAFVVAEPGPGPVEP